MLVLSRRLGEKVIIGGDITVTVVEVKGNRVRLAFDAPDKVCILREELVHNQDGPFDADLARKPAEWHDVSPCFISDSPLSQ